MSLEKRYPLNNDAVIHIKSYPYHEELERELHTIRSLWEEERKEKLLYDGNIVTLLRFDEASLDVALVPYRVLLLIREKPHLQKELSIHPLGFSGICSFHDKVLVGKRSMKLFNYPGYYECAPSGSLDEMHIQGTTYDLSSLVFQELEEETGIRKENVESIHPQALWSSPDGTWDIQVDINVRDGTIPQNTLEYDELFWKNPQEVQIRNHLCPLSKTFLTCEL